MKCPQCSHNHPKREGQVCGQCGYQFVFDKAADGMTDGQFGALQRKASRNDTYYYTENQLYGAWASRKPSSDRKTGGGCLTTIGVGVVIAGMLNVDDGGWLGAIAGAVMLLIGLSIAFVPPSMPARQELTRLVRKWLDAGKELPRLLREPSLEKAAPYREKDIFDYGVERIIVVDDDLLVDLFVRNNLHADQRALVISASGYPHHLKKVAHNLLKQRAELPVICLHDSGPNGRQLAERIRAGKIAFLQPATHVVDAGLFEHQIKQSKLLQRIDNSSGDERVPVDVLGMPALMGGLTAVAALGVADFAAAQQQAGSAGGVADFG